MNPDLPDMSPERRDRLSRTFVELADTLVNDFDVIGFLQMLSRRCVDLFGAASAGIMLQDGNEALQVMASSDERARTLELLELQTDEGPAQDAIRLRSAVQADAAATAERWPTFAQHAVSLGYRAISVVPMRLRSQTVGALNLFHTDDVLLGEVALRDAQALADIATIGLINERTVRESRLVAEQLQHALTSRVSIEQAKGVLAVRLDLDVDAAFEEMRRFARNQNSSITAVARAVVAGDVSAEVLRAGASRR